MRVNKPRPVWTSLPIRSSRYRKFLKNTEPEDTVRQMDEVLAYIMIMPLSNLGFQLGNPTRIKKTCVPQTGAEQFRTQTEESACVCVYYCSIYYKAVRVGGRGIVEDMCCERRRAETPVL
jgi:hypothetical protein